MYKPGEEVSLKGWLRSIDYGKGGDVGGLGGEVDARHVQGDRLAAATQIAKGSAKVSAVGGFDTKFTLPKTPNLGYAHVSFDDAGPLRERVLRTASRSRSSAGPSSRSRAGEPGAVPRRRQRRRHGQREVLRGRSAARRAGQLVRHREPDELHAAEPRRLRVRRAGSRGGAIAAGTTTSGGARYAAAEELVARRQDRRDRRARAAHRLPVAQPGDADVGHRERERDRRQSPDVVGVGGADRPSVVAATSASRRRSRSSRRARRSTST